MPGTWKNTSISEVVIAQIREVEVYVGIPVPTTPETLRTNASIWFVQPGFDEFDEYINLVRFRC